MLQLNSVSAGYGAINVLEDVDLSVEAGEVVTIVGGNGAGKTTTLRTISGLVTPSRGEIRFEGKNIAGMASHDIVDFGITMIPEARQLFPDMTVRENLQMGAYRSGAQAGLKQRLDEVVAMFPRIGERLDQRAESLSGGEQQMVAIGRGMMARPRLLMFDEPSLGLAPIIVSQVFEVIGQIARTGTTVLIVEQNVYQTLKAADRGYVLENGRVTMADTAESLLGNDHVRRAYLGI
ncbi:ABC transporter ATP-binding protein [Salinisphaera orenii]|uniref:Amino acid ABC transporter ATPase n=1 Tax=Salinisphaera orenii YIM 95161 TaxID=1051139 RepID=A0A423PDK3_9GAMM|nr:ABC transporter ATP-binding protein [Salinisphaera halophila]ROO23107.1 amino acid ABC transporter ATPase [Salinisphaera halophila YIM 95161]